MSNLDQLTTEYDPCIPPVCPDDTTIRVTSYDNEVCVDDITYVSWAIDGNVQSPSQNNLLWSLNNQSFSNSSPSLSNNDPFYAGINVPGTVGVIYFKVRVSIGGTFYESSVYTITVIDDTDICGGIEYIVPAKGCVCFGIDTPDVIWVQEEGVPKVPNGPNGIVTVFFRYNDECFFIDTDSIDNRTLYDNQSVTILDSVSNDFQDCETCCNLIPSCEFSDEAGDGGSEGFHKVYYIGNTECLTLKYKTFKIKDRFIVKNNDTGEVLYDGGCEGTGWFKPVNINTSGVDYVSITVTMNDANGVKCDPNWTGTAWEFKVTCCEPSSSSSTSSNSSSTSSNSSSTSSFSSTSSTSSSTSSFSSTSSTSSTSSSTSSTSSSSSTEYDDCDGCSVDPAGWATFEAFCSGLSCLFGGGNACGTVFKDDGCNWHIDTVGNGTFYITVVNRSPAHPYGQFQAVHEDGDCTILDADSWRIPPDVTGLCFELWGSGITGDGGGYAGPKIS